MSDTDDRTTPRSFFAPLDAEFAFQLDVCATARNTRCRAWLGPGSFLATDAFEVETWLDLGSPLWMNPPYSELPRWVGRAADEVLRTPGGIIVALLPSNTSARWFQDYVWDQTIHDWRVWVRQVRFVPQRLVFHPHTRNAMWPSMLVVFEAPASETLLIEAAPPLPPARGRTTEWVDRAVQLYTSIYIKERAPHGAVAVLDAILRNLTPQEQADYYARIDALRRRRAAARP